MSSPAASPPFAELFSSAELLAIFPAAPPVESPLSARTPSGDDPAAPLRAANPLTRAALEKELEISSVLHTAARLQLTFAPFARAIFARNLLLVFTPEALAAAPVWVFGRGLFGTQQLIVGSVCIVLFVWLVPMFLALPSAAGRNLGTKSDVLDHHSLSGIARWLQLIRDTCGEASIDVSPVTKEAASPTLTSSELIRHRADDPQCSCPAASCAGALLHRAGMTRLIEVAGRAALWCFTCLASVWTATVTLGPQLWTSGWAAVGVWAIGGGLVVHTLANAGRHFTNVPLLDHTLRVHRRAMDIALSDLVDRLRRDLVPDGLPEPPKREIAGQEPFLWLHTRLTALWRHRFSLVQSGWPMILFVALPWTLYGIASVAVGNCLPAFVLIGLSLIAVNVVADLVNFASGNAQIGSVLELYRAASFEIRRLVARAREPGSLASDRAVLRAEAADRLLESCLAAERFEAKLFGAAVDTAGVRRFAAGLVTVALGFYSVLRGSGVVLTMDNYCR